MPTFGFLPFDPTPGFNITKNNAGGGVPFIDFDANNKPSTRTGNEPRISGGSNDLQVSPAPLAPSGNYTGGGVDTTAARAQAAADAREKANILFALDQQINSAQQGLGRLDGQLNTGLSNVNRDYQDAYNRLIGQKRRVESDYGTGMTDQLNQYQSARNQGATAARGFMESARRTLGAQGAGGGSAARYGVPYQAQQQAAATNAEAQSVNNRNVSALTSNWNRAKDDFTNSENDLVRQRDQGINDYRSRIESQRAELLNSIGTLSGQKAIANGGNYQGAMAASQPYTSKIAAILNSIDSLAATPAIREQAVTVGRPDLSGYNFAAPETPVAAIQDPSLAGNVIYGQQEEEVRNPILSLFGLDDQYQTV